MQVLAVVVCLSVRPSVRPSVTSWCSTETVKHTITQTTPHDSPRTVVFWCPKISANLERRRRMAGWLNAGTMAANWRLSPRSVVNAARSQVYRTERLPCSTFAVTQRVARVCPRTNGYILLPGPCSSCIRIRLNIVPSGHYVKLMF